MGFIATLQKADFSCAEQPVTGPDDALALLAEFDWQQECSRAGEMALRGEDPCFPGICFSEGLNQLHFFRPGMDVLIVYVAKPRRKWLGILPLPLFSRMFVLDDEQAVPQLVALFFARQFDALAGEACARREHS